MPDVSPEATAIWMYEPADHYRTPPEPSSEKVRSGFLKLMDKLRRRKTAEESFVSVKNLRHVPDKILSRAAPIPDWEDSVAALSKNLESWSGLLSQQPDIRVFLSPPFSGITRSLTLWANRTHCRIMSPPSLDQILSSEALDWGNHDDRKDSIFVIAGLERFFIRHYNGLDLIRHIMRRLSSTPCRCLISCDSWAWAYFIHALDIQRMMPPPVTLSAFDRDRLRKWFQELSVRGDIKQPAFRQADDGCYVIQHPENVQASETADLHPTEKELSDFLYHLAACSRGNPGTAWHIWRHSLRCEPDEAFKDSNDIDMGKETIWVKPWKQLALTTLPEDLTKEELLLLHSLLLHGGVSLPVLEKIVPMPCHCLEQSLFRMASLGLTEVSNQTWRVTPLSYPAVRRYVENEGYLVDAF